MNYYQVYHQLIDHALERDHCPRPSHRHHIVPRAHNGSDHSSNLVQLTLKEHMLAHTLLAHIDPDQWHAVELIAQTMRVELEYRLPSVKRRMIAYSHARQLRLYNQLRSHQMITTMCEE